MLPLIVLLASGQTAPVKVLFSGDVTLGYHYEEYVDELVKKGMPVADAQAWGFKEVKALTQAADCFVVNLECPFTTGGEKIAKNFNFRARPELVATLLAGGVDVASLANNHLMDYGAEGLFDTLKTLDEVKIAHFGAGRDLAAARAPRIVDIKGVKVAFLGYFFLGDRNIEPKEVIATENTPGVSGEFSDVTVLTKRVVADVRAAKKKAHHVVPFFHWGREGKAEPEAYQVSLARAAIDAGASAVLGSHPHVLQPIVTYKGAPVVYSLGNFVFGGNWDPKDKRSALFEMTLTPESVVGYRAIPARSDSYPEKPVQPSLVEGEAALDVLRRLQLEPIDAGTAN